MEKVRCSDILISNMKLVREDINFKREKDPKVALGLGLKAEIKIMRDKLSEYYDESYSKIDDSYFAGITEGMEYAIGLLDELSIMKK